MEIRTAFITTQEMTVGQFIQLQVSLKTYSLEKPSMKKFILPMIQIQKFLIQSQIPGQAG